MKSTGSWPPCTPESVGAPHSHDEPNTGTPVRGEEQGCDYGKPPPLWGAGKCKCTPPPSFSKAHPVHTLAGNVCWVLTKGQLEYCKTPHQSYSAVTDLISLKVSEIVPFLFYAAQYNLQKESCVSFSLCFIKLLKICLQLIGKVCFAPPEWQLLTVSAAHFRPETTPHPVRNTGAKFYVLAVRER